MGMDSGKYKVAQVKQGGIDCGTLGRRWDSLRGHVPGWAPFPLSTIILPLFLPFVICPYSEQNVTTHQVTYLILFTTI